MLRRFFILAALLVNTAAAAQTVRLEISALPVSHSPGSNIYLAGSFNNWNPNDDQYKFRYDTAGLYFLHLNLPAGKYEYKLTRGDWSKVECKKAGEDILNRKLVIETNTTIQLAIEEWKDNLTQKPRVSTASKNVKILDTTFYIPQLGRKRTVRIYLPEDYYRSRHRYPVLYMQDGQNLFDDTSSFSGEWGVDEFLDTTRYPKCIVVGIDNGGAKRMNEYNPWDHHNFGKGEGVLYVDFIAKILKPDIDKRYRTDRSKQATFIAGSSMGGLISLLAVLQYPKVFGGAGVFSPSVWIAKQDLLKLVNQKGRKIKPKLYFYCGLQESETMATDMLKVFETMMKTSKAKMISVIRNEGKHNEATWRKEFPLFYEWIVGAQS